MKKRSNDAAAEKFEDPIYKYKKEMNSNYRSSLLYSAASESSCC